MVKKKPIHNSIHHFSCLQCVFQWQETFLHSCATISIHSTLLSIFPNQSSILSTQVLWSLLPPSPPLPEPHINSLSVNSTMCCMKMKAYNIYPFLFGLFYVD